MKYEEPCLEIVKFDFKNNILTASMGGETEDPVQKGSDETIDEDFDPFA